MSRLRNGNYGSRCGTNREFAVTEEAAPSGIGQTRRRNQWFAWGDPRRPNKTIRPWHTSTCRFRLRSSEGDSSEFANFGSGTGGARGNTGDTFSTVLAMGTFGALILGAIGFGTAEMGFYRQTEWSVNYSASGEQISKTGNGTFKFYGIELLNSDDLDSFKRKSNVIGMLIIGTASVGSGLIGGTLGFIALRRLARPKGDLG